MNIDRNIAAEAERRRDGARRVRVNLMGRAHQLKSDVNPKYRRVPIAERIEIAVIRARIGLPIDG